MPQNPTLSLPGIQGKDYYFVAYGGKTYVVYSMELPGGKTIRLSWRVEDPDVFGVKSEHVRHITAGQFKALNYMGQASEIAGGLPDEHPFQKYLNQLRQTYGGHVSWLSDTEFMGIFLQGWAEGWSADRLQKTLEGTHWYKSRTDYQRQWELETAPADRKSAIAAMTTQVTDALRDIYGVGFNLADAGITQKQIAGWVKDIASGVYGSPADGFQEWYSDQTHQAELIEGTPAWISLQQTLEEQRNFLNKPEDVFEQIKQQATYWLGPIGIPSDETLKKWANDLVSGVSSDADWTQFLQNKAKTAYPYLGANEPWQEFADPYRQLAEKLWGKPIDWSNPILGRLGVVDESGRATDSPVSYHDFELLVRQDPQFWQGDVARQEGFDLLTTLLNKFKGIG